MAILGIRIHDKLGFQFLVPRHSKRLRVLTNVHCIVFSLVEVCRVMSDGLDLVVMILFKILVLVVKLVFVDAIFAAFVQYLLLGLVHFIQFILAATVSMECMEHTFDPVFFLAILGLEIFLVEVVSFSFLDNGLFFGNHLVVMALAASIPVKWFEHVVKHSHLDSSRRRGRRCHGAPQDRWMETIHCDGGVGKKGEETARDLHGVLCLSFKEKKNEMRTGDARKIWASRSFDVVLMILPDKIKLTVNHDYVLVLFSQLLYLDQTQRQSVLRRMMIALGRLPHASLR